MTKCFFIIELIFYLCKPDIFCDELGMSRFYFCIFMPVVKSYNNKIISSVALLILVSVCIIAFTHVYVCEYACMFVSMLVLFLLPS